MSFGREVFDGSLCAESSGKLYGLREVIEMSKKLGRPMTDKAYEEFSIKESYRRN